MPNGNGHPVEILNLPHWRYSPKLKGLSGIYFNTAIRNLAFSLMGIFMPIYLFKVTGQLHLVFLFYFISEFFVIVTTILATKIIRKVGPDVSMLLSNITRSTYLVMLIFAKSNPVIFWLAPFFAGITVPLYWLPYHSAFSSQSKRKRLSKQIARVSNITRVVTISAPLIGGFIAEMMGVDALFPIGILLLITSSLPIFLDEYNQKEIISSPEEISNKMVVPKNRKLFLGLFFEGLHLPLNSIGWPLILYAVIPNFEKIGGLTTITSIACFFTVIWLSKKINHFNVKAFASGNITRVFIWIIRGLSLTNPLLIAFSDPIFNIASVFFGLPYSIMTYDLGKKNGLLFFTQREFALHGGYMIGNFVFFLILFLGSSWKPIIVLTTIFTALMTLFLSSYGRDHLKRKLLSFRPKFGKL